METLHLLLYKEFSDVVEIHTFYNTARQLNSDFELNIPNRILQLYYEKRKITVDQYIKLSKVKLIMKDIWQIGQLKIREPRLLEFFAFDEDFDNSITVKEMIKCMRNMGFQVPRYQFLRNAFLKLSGGGESLNYV